MRVKMVGEDGRVDEGGSESRVCANACGRRLKEESVRGVSAEESVQCRGFEEEE